jgi:outer membrane biosynthesis protein TonB
MKNTTKNIKIGFLGIIALLSTLSTSAKTGNGIETSAPAKIKKSISLPKELKEQKINERVKVIFTVNELGKVSEVVAVTTNAELRKSLENQFKNLSFEGFKANVANTIMLNFKVY